MNVSFICGVLFTVCLWNNVVSQTCEKGRQSFLIRKFAVICKDVQNVFPNFSIAASSITCENCKIPIFSKDVLPFNFTGEVFNVSNSQIVNITENAFQNFGTSIRKLIFSNNDISYIEPKVFSNISSLDELNLKGNNLREILPGVFEKLSINLFDLSENSINNARNFVKGIKVMKLNLSRNKITAITVNLFNETSFWTSNKYKSIFHELDLNNNQIETIIPGSFQFNQDSSLRNLYLQSNKISFIPNNTFSTLPDLRNLNLDSNIIEKLESDSFNNLGNLVSLSLANNKLAILPFGIFSKLQHLETLNLESNELRSLDPTLFSGLISLNKLYLAHNKLKEFKPSTIFPLGKLTFLDISDNRLRDLDLKKIYSQQSRLNGVVINDNFWTCSKLVNMYKAMNSKSGGFYNPAKHFDVPNLHGIACSRVALDYDEDMTFQEFLNIISQDRVFEDIYDLRINNEGDLMEVAVKNLIVKINGIFWMFLFVTFMCTIFFARFIFETVKSNKIVANKLNFSYSRTEDENVQLM